MKPIKKFVVEMVVMVYIVQVANEFCC